MEQLPSRDEVRTILAAAADVVFSDGVSDGFLDQWTEETMFVLGVQRTVKPSVTSPPR